MVRYLIEQGSDPAASDSSDTYAAHYAAAYGWHDILTLLHKCNASMNVTNMLKTSPLFIAMIKGTAVNIITHHHYPSVYQASMMI